MHRPTADDWNMQMRGEETELKPAPNLVSVVIPVRNGAATLPFQLKALEQQDYEGDWELVVVDNGSTDGTDRLVTEWRTRLQVRLVEAADAPGISYARNTGVKSARGDLLAFCDSDDVAAPDWLSEMISAARSADMVEGRLELGKLNPHVREWLSRSNQAPLRPFGDFLPFATGANFCVWKSVATALDGWNLAYEFGGDDVEFSLRLQLAGYQLSHCSSAVMHYRLRYKVAALARQHYRYGKCHAQVFKDFKRYGMPRSKLLIVFKTWGWLATHAYWLLGGHYRRRHWVRIAAKRIGRIVGSFRFRTIYL